jgi:ATP-dependent Clp protease ATP-binding subunit ClpA
MPKINVYLPDELADAVRESGVPVSAICQRALEQSVRRVTAIRATTLGDLETDDPTARLSQFTERTRTVIKLAIGQAREAGAAAVGTEHLLAGMLTEGTNLALHVLRAIDVDPDQVARDLTRAVPASTDPAGPPANRFSGPAANALELTVTEAIALGHNYVGCEHLLLGLVAESDGTAGEVLRATGVDTRSVRRAVVAALAGYVHLRANQPPADLIATAVRTELQPLVTRIERLEERAGR